MAKVATGTRAVALAEQGYLPFLGVVGVPCVAILLSEAFDGVEVNEAGLGCTVDECGGKFWAFGLRGQGSKRVSTPECVMAVKGAYLK